MASESMENIRNEVESVVNEVVSRIYKQEQKLLAMRIPYGDAMDW